VNYFENGFNNMINFEFKYDAQKKIWIYILKIFYHSKWRIERIYVLNYLSIFSWWRWSIWRKEPKLSRSRYKTITFSRSCSVYTVMKVPVL
jgi:hypothetical protein